MPAVRDLTSRYRLVYWDCTEAGDKPLPPAAAIGWIPSWLTDPECRAEVAEIFSLVASRSRPNKGWLDDMDLHHFVLPAIERALGTGELVLVERFKAGALPALEKPEDIEPPSTPKQEPESKKTWVEFEVLDENGDPLKDEKYEARLTDGTVKKGQTDSKGIARFEDIDPGVVQFTLVERDSDTWKSSSEPEPEVEFLQFELVDENDTGVPDEPFELALADKTKRTGLTDPDGQVRIEDLPKGKVELTFTDLDGGSWKKL